MRKSVFAVICLFVFSACNNNQSPFSLEEKLRQQSNMEKAEQLALEGERWAYGAGFMYANDFIDQALAYDPTNVRAQFYKAYLGPHRALKGILRRIEPFVATLSTQQQNDYANFVARIRAGELKDYLLAGMPDIKTEKDIQAFISTLQDAFRNIRLTAQKFADKDFVIHVYPNYGVQLNSLDDINKVAGGCRLHKISETTFQPVNCENLTPIDYKLNYADWGMLRIYAAAYQVYAGLYTSYDATGLENVAMQLQNVKYPTDKYIVTLLSMQPQLGKLVNSAALKDVLSTGAEGIEAVKIALTKQSELCPVGTSYSGNRPGYLFTAGICVDKKLEASIPFWENAVKGPVPVMYSYGNSQHSTIEDFTRPLNGSIADMKTLLPTKFDKCENAKNFGDETLGGLFPQGDASLIYHSFFNKPCYR